jgi:restriction system protein
MEHHDVRHENLGRFHRITGSANPAAEARAAELSALWDRQWNRRKAVEAKIDIATRQALKQLQAEEMTGEAETRLAALTSILLAALKPRPAVNWTAHLDKRDFSEPPPVSPAPLAIAREPQGTDLKFNPPRLPLFQRLIHPSRQRELTGAARAAFQAAHEEWNSTVGWFSREHAESTKRFEAGLNDWDARRSAFYAAQGRANARIEELQKRYAMNDAGAVAAACDLALLGAPRPEGFPKFWRIAFDVDAGEMTADYELPAPSDLPAIKVVKYAAGRDAFEETVLSERETAALYEEAMYQTCLAALHLMFASDSGDTIRSIVFNGWVNHIDTRAGCPARACILSLRAAKEIFSAIDLSGVDPKTCFRKLGGAAGARLADLEPVEPAVE